MQQQRGHDGLTCFGMTPTVGLFDENMLKKTRHTQRIINSIPQISEVRINMTEVHARTGLLIRSLKVTHGRKTNDGIVMVFS